MPVFSQSFRPVTAFVVNKVRHRVLFAQPHWKHRFEEGGRVPPLMPGEGRIERFEEGQWREVCKFSERRGIPITLPGDLLAALVMNVRFK